MFVHTSAVMTTSAAFGLPPLLPSACARTIAYNVINNTMQHAAYDAMRHDGVLTATMTIQTQ